MKLELHKYRNNVKVIEMMLKREMISNDYKKQMSEISVALGVPVLAVCYFALEVLGPNSQIEENIESLKIFYKYDEVSE